MNELTVRPGTVDDLPAVAAIYTHYVLNTTVTFNTHVKTPREWREHHDQYVVNGPYHLYVAERLGQVVGFCQTNRFRPKPAYDTSLEVTIYASPDVLGAGVGRALYGRLFDELRASPFHRAYALIALPNDTSVRFHERHGFVHRGTLTEVGHKFGQFIDVAFYERPL